MAFDDPTRRRLARFVGDSRALLTEEFTRQLQHDYGLDPTSGDIADLTRLDHLDDARRETARLLRETLAYYLAGQTKQTAQARRESLERMVREQAFTVLNRLCALRMMEARGLLLESVGQGYRSKGFQLYNRLAGPALGETGDTYCSYLFSLFDEFAVDLPVLFDRFSPQGRLFPRPTTLLQLLDEINHPDIDRLWAEDETIGWIYQYFNSVEERRQMRAESAAPRNSRELAVRNQFFTPRYVVEFLTDNTLGRLWYEMTQGNTALKESCRYLVRRPTEIFLAGGETAPNQPEREAGLSEEELFKQPVYIPYRPLKDPRDLKLLDPACGSMHFGLYAFDLYEQVYAEAWVLEERRGPHALTRPPGLRPLRETYSNEATFRRDIPRLIIEHNIHGIDIDPRAVQIAGLSLWLRAQKSWQSQGVKAVERPVITRSNVVIAEPMPGDAALLDEFIGRYLTRTAEERLLGQLLRRVFEAMKLAGEVGSLLKIEEEIAADVAEAKAKWYAQAEPKQASFLDDATKPEQAELGLDVSGITDAAFWTQAEVRIYEALQLYAEQAENRNSLRLRLFAEDVARGFAFIDLCRQRYDVVLMNPPFGEPVKRTRELLNSRYYHTKHDLFAAFTERTIEMLKRSGFVGEISSRVGFFIKSFEDWRKSIVGLHSVDVIIDLGTGVLDDATVEVASYVIQKSHLLRNKSTLVARLLTDANKENALRDVLGSSSDSRLFNFRIEDCDLLPLSPWIYWVSLRTRKLLANQPALEPKGAIIRQGLGTGENDRFIRVLWEIPNHLIASTVTENKEFNEQFREGKKWAVHVRSGSSQPWYSPLTVVIDWECDGAHLKGRWESKGETPSRYIPSEQLYFLPGFSWTRRAFRLIPYVIPEGCIPSASRYMGFPNVGEEIQVVGILASNLAACFARFYGEMFERPNHLVDTVKKIPYVDLPKKLLQDIEEKIQQEVEKRRNFFRNYEPFWDFVVPAVIQQWSNDESQAWNPYSFLGKTMDTQIAVIFGLTEEQLSELELDLREAIQVRNQSNNSNNELGGEESDTDSICDISAYGKMADLVSYGIGCVFGRWDILLATQDKPTLKLPDPFAPLPMCPPGMLQNSQGVPATLSDVPPDYPLRISWPGILVDDPGHPENIESRVQEALRVIWPDTTDAIEQEACQILDVGSLRDYFANPNQFFDDHLKRYSKSRRAAPIYWPLSTPAGSYTLWLYYHRLDNQILYTCVNDFVDPKLKDLSPQVSALRQKANRNKSEEADLTRLSDLETELHDFRAELLRLATFWRPNLNDGVEITAAPLWRLFQYRPWQSRLKETWDKLEAGEYDWAHLAMSIWSERVVPQCAEDRSLAIAHDIEDLFWVEDEGNWRLLQEADQEIAGQIERRQNPAHTRLGQYLADLAAGAGRGMPAYQVWQHLSEGDWDDTRVALALWPERVAEKCWDAPFLAAQLGLKISGKQTEANRQRFLKQIVAESVPALVEVVAAAFQDESDAFDAVWQSLVNGKWDEQPLALTLWPKRVVDKCAGKVELATQHNLRRYFWVQSPGGGPWRRRNPQAQEIRDEIARRRNDTGRA